MNTTLQTVLRQRVREPVAAQSTLSYPDLVALTQQMQRQDPKIVFDSLRPMGDEFWNLIDGQRTVAQIAEEVCLQFGFELDPALLLPLAQGLVRERLAEAVS